MSVLVTENLRNRLILKTCCNLFTSDQNTEHGYYVCTVYDRSFRL